jgi:hypothetical protein
MPFVQSRLYDKRPRRTSIRACFSICFCTVFWLCDAQLQRIFELGGASVLAYTNAHLAPDRSLSQSMHPASYTLLSAGV